MKTNEVYANLLLTVFAIISALLANDVLLE